MARRFTFLDSIIRLAALALALLAPALPAASWHVDAAATGLNNGTSRADAWKSFAAINWSVLQGGDVVWVADGAYPERVVVAKGGASANARITFVGAPGQPTIRGVNGGAFDYLAWINFEITHPNSSHNYSAFHLAGCEGWLIQDNYIHRTYAGGINGAFSTVNSNNIIRGNTFDDIASIDGGRATLDGGATYSNPPVISIFGDTNLIDYNTIRKSLDRVRAFGRGNVVRNNYFAATDAALYPKTTPYPHHTDGFQSYNSSRLLTQLLYERNWDEDNTDSVNGTNAHGFLLQDDGAGMNWAIARFNVLIRPGGAAYQFRGFDRFYGYNLTSIAVQHGAPNLFRSAVTFDSGPRGGGNLHDWRNNTWSNCPRCIDASGIITTSNRPTNFTADYQHAYNAGGAQGVLPAAAHNLPAVDPRFRNSAADDYTLQSSSPLRGAGGPLTATVGAGSNSTRLVVSDARRLFDGWGLAESDTIKIGAGNFVRIASIDYPNNIVTLAAPRSWSSGEPVIVKGMEDIGALPFVYATPVSVTNTTPATLPAGPVTLSATVGDPNAVRMVEFLVDGLPVGIDYDPPYAVAWTADGAPHNVEARAYNAWASRTLWQREFNTAPRLSSQPQSQRQDQGSTVTFTITATAPYPITYEWRRNGVKLANGGHVSGATGPSLTLTHVTLAEAGSYTVVATNAIDSTPSQPATLTVNFARLTNFSVRSQAGAGDATLIAGFSVRGSASKSLLLRGIGPALAAFGVGGMVADPRLRLFNSSAIEINQNDNWGGGAALAGAFAAVGAFPLSPASADAALLVSLPAGRYSAQLASADGTGIAMVEGYDRVPLAPPARIDNVSVRSAVGTGPDVLIVGFSITGNVPMTLLIRGVGPTLQGYGVDGVLADPQLRLFNAARDEIDGNDDWGGATSLAATFSRTGAFPLPVASRDAALVVSLPAGSYTAQVSGVGSTTGVALVELYEVL